MEHILEQGFPHTSVGFRLAFRQTIQNLPSLRGKRDFRNVNLIPHAQTALSHGFRGGRYNLVLNPQTVVDPQHKQYLFFFLYHLLHRLVSSVLFMFLPFTLHVSFSKEAAQSYKSINVPE